MLEEIDRLNIHKFHTSKNLTTTEQVTVNDVMTFTVLADEMKQKIQLPSNGILANYFTINYVWGSIIVMCEIQKN